MNSREGLLDSLFARARQGDSTAAAELLRHLGPHLAWIVRRALHVDECNLPLTRRVRALAEVAAGSRTDADPEELIAPTLDLIRQRLWSSDVPEQALKDTVRG